VLLSSGDSFPHLIQKPRSQLGFVTYLLNYLRITVCRRVKDFTLKTEDGVAETCSVRGEIRNTYR
jgi:hypothetical protein